MPEDSQQQAGSDDAFEKLKELAERQQKLAEAAARKEEQTKAERWQQEKLKRDLEELQRELEELQRNQQASNQQQQGQQGQQGDEQQGRQSGQQSQQSSGGQGSQSQQAMQNLQEAINELNELEQNAASMTPEERRQAMQSASERLRQSLEQTAEARQQELQQQLTDASDAVRDLSQRQQQTSQELREAMRRAIEAREQNRFESGLDQREEQRLAETKRQFQRELESIRDDITETTKRFAEQAPLSTERLEQTLEELDRNQLAELMGISGDMIEEGLAPQAALREERINNALQNLQTDLFESSSLAAAETGLNDESENTVADATRAVQQLRQALAEAIAQGGEGSGEQTAELQQLEGSSQQDGSNSDQQGQGNSQSEQQGQGEGQSSSQGQSQSQGNSQSGGRLGGSSSWRPNNAQATDTDIPVNNDQVQLIEESIRQLQGLGNELTGELSEQTIEDLNAVTEQLQIGNDSENNRRIEANVRLLLRQLEQLELQIYNDSKDFQVTRSKQRVADPDGFDNQTADYFRRLSEPAGS